MDRHVASLLAMTPDRHVTSFLAMTTDPSLRAQRGNPFFI